jgi:formylglycine-generating enzyme required for sulfatase activity
MAGLKDEVGADPAAKNGVNQTHYPWSATGTFPPSGMSVNLDATKIVGFSDNYAYTAPVTAEYFNDFDIVGLGGNVAEWCSDAWPGADQERIIRGGSWLMSDKQQLLTSARRHVSLNAAAPDVGFRVVIDFTAP